MSTDLGRVYSYRLTRAHVEWSVIREIISRYSSSWAACLHMPDSVEAECQEEHFHFVMLDLDPKKVDAMKKCIAKNFSSKGSCLHAGRFRDGDVLGAISYMKHDEFGAFYHSGEEFWKKFINESPSYVHVKASRKRIIPND